MARRPPRHTPRSRALALVAVLLGPAGAAAGPLARDFDAPVLALVEHAGLLVAGGRFATADGHPAPWLARWDGEAWSPWPGLNGAVCALAVLDGELVAGGEFTQADGFEVGHVARWNGSAWEALGAGTNGPVRALFVQSGVVLFAGGEFTQAGGVEAHGVARWLVSSWSALGKGLEGEVRALSYFGGLVAAGDFHTREGDTFEYSFLARFDGRRWSTPAPGLDGPVNALVLHDGALVIGGAFLQADFITPALGVARLVGSEWNALRIGLWSGEDMQPAEVRALAVDGGGDLLAGGTFTHAPSQVVNHVARWDGSDWFALAEGVDAPVNALLGGTGALYAGGEFAQAGTVPAERVAAFDGSAWHALRTTPAAVFDLEAAAHDGRVRLRWRLSQAALATTRAVRLLRGVELQGPFEERARLAPRLAMEHEDAGVAPGRPHWYVLELESGDGTRTLAGRLQVRGLGFETGVRLHPPQPAGDAWMVAYAVGGAVALPVRLDLYDVRGRHVRRLDAGLRPPGEHVRTWDRRDGAGRPAARGLYLVHLRAGGRSATRKLLLTGP